MYPYIVHCYGYSGLTAPTELTEATLHALAAALASIY